MRRTLMLACIGYFILAYSNCLWSVETPWWKQWDNYPKVPRITVEEIKKLMIEGQPIAFVYAGYKVNEILCGAAIVPYTWVPPNSDGSRVRLKITKNHWVMVYCP